MCVIILQVIVEKKNIYWEVLFAGFQTSLAHYLNQARSKLPTISGLWTRIYLIKVTMNQSTQ